MLENKKRFFSLFNFFVFISVLFLLNSCSRLKNEDRIVIWTDNSEFASYTELFNKTHKEKAVLVFKENPSASLPPEENELEPDLVIGSWLKNEHTKRFFEPIDYLFERKFILSENFYTILLDAGKLSNRQYLLPVSFNIPVIIFSKENEEFAEENYMLTLDDIKKAGELFNQKNNNGSFFRMGFAPESSDDFLYLVSKIKGADFKEARGNYFSWNQEALQSSIDFLEKWINEANDSSQTERDFVYKYLSVTDDKRVTQGRTLFAYTTSDKLFRYSSQQLSLLDYRWISEDGKIPVEDSMVMMGLPKTARNYKGAAEFISWLFSFQTQSEIFERKFSMNLDTNSFGIANGFSSIKEVTERVLPIYYTALLSNIPQAGTFKVYSQKPIRWEIAKQKVIIPYIKDSIASDGTKKVQTIEERFSEWRHQGFN